MRTLKATLTSLFCILIIQTFSVPTLIAFQDDERSLAELQAEWKELDGQFASKEAALNAGGNIEKAQEEYNQLLEQANQLIAKIESAALAELDKNSNDSKAIRALLGIMINEAGKDRPGKVLSLGNELIGHNINSEYFKIAAKMERLSTPAREIFDELVIRQKETIDNNLPRVKFETTQGDIVVELFENEAPNTVGNFVSLVEKGYYDDMLFHRVADEFMAQTGGFKYNADGEEYKFDGPGYTIKCECYEPDTRLHFPDSLSMAHLGTKNTGGAQFFLTFRRTSHLDKLHTCFGRVIGGYEILDKLARTHVSDPRAQGGTREIPGIKKDKIVSAKLLRKRNHDYAPDKVGSASPETNK